MTASTEKQWDLDTRIGDWTVAELLSFMTSVQRMTPRAGAGMSFAEYMKRVPRWQDERDTEAIVREIYEARTMGRDVEL
ncbi:MAG: hypothetical protein JW910_15855 [Anaerolineae bacterium]|nr:hypothetical protein [Anaerolineae bacterium]